MQKWFVIFILFLIPAFSGAITLNDNSFYPGYDIIVSDVVYSKKIYLYNNEAAYPICQVTSNYTAPINVLSVCGSLPIADYIIIQSGSGAPYMMYHTLIQARDNNYSDAEFSFSITPIKIIKMPISGYADVLSTTGFLFTDLWRLIATLIGLVVAFYIFDRITDVYPK